MTAPRRRILALDDEAQILETLRFILEDAGYEVDCCLNARDALFAHEQSLDGRPYDLMILDIVLPGGKSGLDILQEVRRREKKRGVLPEVRVPVLMLTGLKDRWAEDAFRDGCTDYMIKPFEMDFLLRKVEALAGRKERKGSL